MHYLIKHETVLEYPAPIRENHIELRLVPRQDSHQTILSCTLETEPEAERSSYTDYFGNRVDYFCVIAPHDRLVTRLECEVETVRENPFDFVSLSPEEEQKWLKQQLRATPSLYDCLLHRSLVTPSADKLNEALECPLPGRDTGKQVLNSLMELMEWVSATLEYRPGTTEVHGALEAALKQGGGVCQDFAHLFITVARFYGIPARYVMGFMDSGTNKHETSLATHAWAEALVPGAGWLGFDATHNLLVNDHYVAVAVGRDSYDAAPQRGSFKGSSPGLQPQVTVSMQEQ